MNFLPWCVAVPFILAALLLAGASIVNRAITTAIALTTAIAVVILCTLVLEQSLARGVLTYWFGGWHPGNHLGLGIAFEVEPFGAGLALIVAVLTAAALAYGYRSFDEVGVTFDVLVLVHLGAAIAFVYTSDLFDLIVFYELTNVTEFALAGYKVGTPLAVRGAFNFAIATGLGAFALIFGLTLLEGRTGGLNAAAIGESLMRAPSPVLASCAFGLIVAGLLVKSALPPFHFWFVDAQTAAPTPVGVLFSGGVSVLGIYALERVWTTTFAHALAPSAAVVHYSLAVLGMTGACVAALLAFTAADLKRSLAFATAAQMGIIVAAGTATDARSLAAAAFLVIGFAFPIAALAMWVGVLHHRLDTVIDEEYRGGGRGHRSSAVLALLGIVGISGLPPVPTAFGRAMLPLPLAMLSVLVGGVIAARFALAAWRAYGERGSATKDAHDEEPNSWLLVLPGLVLGVCSFASGALPWAPFAAAAVAFVDPDTMSQALLHHVVRSPEANVLPAPQSGRIVFLATATLVATIVAVAILPAVRSFGVVRTLHGVHNGSVGDYVTWLLGGVATITAVAVAVAAH